MINTAIIMGRLTADPELRKTNTGVSVGLSAISRCKISVPKAEEPPKNKFEKFDAV